MTDRSNYHSRGKRSFCYFCESGPPLREHHIIPQRFGGPNTEENIVELCDLCHTRIERLYDKSFYEWFGINDSKGERKYHRPCNMWKCKNRRQVKVNTVIEPYHATIIGNRWSIGVDMRARDIQYFCRPCAAKIARDMYKVINGERDPDRKGPQMESVLPPGSFESAQEVFDEMVVESADG